MAIVFESRDGGLMFESNLLGTHPKFYKTAQKHMTIVHEVTIPFTLEQEDHAWDLMVDKFDGKPYDYKAILYIGWRRILNRCFKIPIPEINPWRTQGAYFCDELYEILELCGYKSLDVVCGMKTPHMVWASLNTP